jgi:hypothetical protein
MTAQAKRRRRGLRLFSRPRLRLSNILGILHIRHGGEVPFTDDVDHYLVPVANCFHAIAADRGRPAEMERLFAFWCSERAPDVPDAVVAAIAKKELAGPPFLMKDDDVGNLMRVSYAERSRIKGTTLGSYDVDRAGRKKLAKERRKERDRVGAKARRKANGATPREESLSQTEPWKAENISRRTWERRRKKAASAGDANSSPHPFSIVERRICVRTPKGAGAPKRAGADHRAIGLEGVTLAPELDGCAMAPPTLPTEQIPITGAVQ